LGWLLFSEREFVCVSRRHLRRTKQIASARLEARLKGKAEFFIVGVCFLDLVPSGKCNFAVQGC
jgi:hypothetical protein